jgi:excisionase family DNA binding protein
MNKSFLSIKEASEILGVHRLTIRRLIDEGALPVLVVRRRRLIPREAFEDFIKKNTVVKGDPVAQALEEVGR